jgi:ABC-type spermidine/putrescine transport system permease subunit II
MSLLLAGLPVSVPGETVNRLCASGMSACITAARVIQTGDADLMIGGGVENMTRAPWVISKVSTPYGRDAQMFDSSFGWRFVNPKMKDMYGTDAMGETAENLADRDLITREDQDKFSLWSQEKAAAAQLSGRLAKEIMPVNIQQRKGNEIIFDKDEFMKPASTLEGLAKLTLKNYVTALHFHKITDAIKNSILLGLGSASFVMVLTVLASWLLVRTKIRGRWLLDLLTTLPLLFPGIVMGLAILRFYLFVPIPVYGTLWILLIAFVTRYIPYGIRYTHSGLLQLHKELEEASYVSGASWFGSMRRIVLPLITPSFLGGWIFIFLLSAKELSMSVLLVSPQTPVVSVAIFELWENAQVGELAAFGVIWTAILVTVAILYYVFARRYGIQQH